MSDKLKLSPAQWFRIVRIVMGALGAAGVEYRDAREPDSEGGRKVTPREARDIALLVLSSVVEPVADVLSED